MKNCRKLEAVHTTLIKSGVVFHTPNNKVKLRQGRYTEQACLAGLLLHARGERKIYNKKRK